MKEKKQHRILFVGDNSIEYTLCQKQVKNINLRVRENGEVYVSANPKVSEAYVDKFVASKYEFILQAQERMKNRMIKNGAHVYQDGEKVMYLGTQYTIKVMNDYHERVELVNLELILHVRDIENDKSRKRVFLKWSNERQIEIFQYFARKIYPCFTQYQKEFPEFRLRTMKSIWGSCQPRNGIITLNRRLIEKPLPCIEYVILHEFAHFAYADHSKQFYAVIEKYMPDYKERRKQLNL